MKSYQDYPKINNDRINFSKISGNLELPYLVEIQTESYKNFLSKGIEEVLKDVFPIENNAKTVSIDYVSHRLGEPEHDFYECKEKDLTYNIPFFATFKLTDRSSLNETIIDSEIFMGDIPLMNDSGTFVINGKERVIVSQIIRSPGAYLSSTQDVKSGKYVYNADLIPSRGTWLEFESDVKDLLWVRIDRQRKMPATILLKALGLDSSLINQTFGKRECLTNTLIKDENIKTSKDALVEIFKKLRPGEPITENGVTVYLIQKFFDNKRYDLGKAGRYKYNNKLGIYNRLVDRVLAENLISIDGEIVYKAGQKLTKEMVESLEDDQFFEKGAHQYDLTPNLNQNLLKEMAKINSQNEEAIERCYVNIVKVYGKNDNNKDIVSTVIGTDMNQTNSRVTISDMIAIFSYFLNLMDHFGKTDDIDHLSNRRIRNVGELLQEYFRDGLIKVAKNCEKKMSMTSNQDGKEISIRNLISNRPLASKLNEFFASNQLSNFMDQVNPLSELANKRRISALGPQGIARDRASMAVRDVHFTHYGRICPIETPEGQNIGLINNLATYAKIDKYGFIQAPYRRVDKETGKILDEVDYLTAADENDHVIAQATRDDIENGYLKGERVVARYNGQNILADVKSVDYIDESPMQIVSIAAACIPFLENDDNHRALMGANMQRQALPLLKPHAPLVGTGVEHRIAVDSGLAVIAKEDGVVTYVDSTEIRVRESLGETTYKLRKYQRSNGSTCINQRSVVRKGDVVKKGQLIADGPSMENGDLALGQNVVVAFMTWDGYNYEDAVIMSDRLVKDDVYTSIHIETYDVECRDTKNGEETITSDIPNCRTEDKAYLDENGIVIPGSDVKEGDILVGKITPKGASELSPENKLFEEICGTRAKECKDSSMRVPHGGAGTVLGVHIFSRENKDELEPGVNQKVRVYVAQKRKISEGDKMSGRHGNKGVISRIVPQEDMPFMEDGTPVDILLNPQGVPSRMNIGQILEVHLGMACKALGGMKIATPVFDGVSMDEMDQIMKDAKIPSDGKYALYDGRTGERFDNRINVGVMYMIKLSHMVDDKLHARAVGPYSIVTQQPLGGKAQNGGQRFGEMEVWALEAYGAAYTLQEMMTIKSDDKVGKRRTYESIVKGKDLPKPSIPEAFKVLTRELMGLGLDIKLMDKDNKEINMDAIARQAQKEEHISMQSIYGSNQSSSNEDSMFADPTIDDDVILH